MLLKVSIFCVTSAQGNKCGHASGKGFVELFQIRGCDFVPHLADNFLQPCLQRRAFSPLLVLYLIPEIFNDIQIERISRPTHEPLHALVIKPLVC